jgi:hypothetical protein
MSLHNIKNLYLKKENYGFMTSNTEPGMCNVYAILQLQMVSVNNLKKK